MFYHLYKTFLINSLYYYYCYWQRKTRKIYVSNNRNDYDIKHGRIIFNIISQIFILLLRERSTAFFSARGCIEWSTLRELKSTPTSPPTVSLGDDPEESREGRSVLEEGAERRRPSPKDFDPHHIARFCLRLLHLPSSFPLGTIILIPYILFKRRFAPKSVPRYFRTSP